jgi:hypothetical protein
MLKYSSVDEAKVSTVRSVLQMSETVPAPRGILPDVTDAESFIKDPQDKLNAQLLRVKTSLDELQRFGGRQHTSQSLPDHESLDHNGLQKKAKCTEIGRDLGVYKVQFNYATEVKAEQCGVSRDAWVALMQEQIQAIPVAEWKQYVFPKGKGCSLPGHFAKLDIACKEKAFAGTQDCPHRSWDDIVGGAGPACNTWFTDAGETRSARRKPGAEAFHVYAKCVLHARAAARAFHPAFAQRLSQQHVCLSRLTPRAFRRLFHMIAMLEQSFTDHCQHNQYLNYYK